jgi:oligogalacturonide lyase
VTNGITRRGVLALLPAGLFAQTAPKTKPLPRAGEFVAFSDPTTEARVVRLTNPASASWLPAPANRFVSRDRRFLIFSSDRSGLTAPFQLDLHTGLAHQVAETGGLAPLSLCLDDRERSLYLVDGGMLVEISLSNGKRRAIAEDVEAFAAGGGSEFVIIRSGRLILLSTGRVLADQVSAFCVLRPGTSGCLFSREPSPEEKEFWLVPFDSSGSKPVLLAKGRVSDPFWSPGGSSLLFLRDVPGPNGFVSEIHEVLIATLAEQSVAPTSQFAAFAPNSNASVFVGASRSKAQPTVILLLRSVKRELTLCEHRSSHPALVSPVFSPDSRRVYFESDHEGKPALYSVNVEVLVEPTTAAA